MVAVTGHDEDPVLDAEPHDDTGSDAHTHAGTHPDAHTGAHADTDAKVLTPLPEPTLEWLDPLGPFDAPDAPGEEVPVTRHERAALGWGGLAALLGLIFLVQTAVGRPLR